LQIVDAGITCAIRFIAEAVEREQLIEWQAQQSWNRHPSTPAKALQTKLQHLSENKLNRNYLRFQVPAALERGGLADTQTERMLIHQSWLSASYKEAPHPGGATHSAVNGQKLNAFSA
jgi:hypothetical protein